MVRRRAVQFAYQQSKESSYVSPMTNMTRIPLSCDGLCRLARSGEHLIRSDVSFIFHCWQQNWASRLRLTSLHSFRRSLKVCFNFRLLSVRPSSATAHPVKVWMHVSLGWTDAWAGVFLMCNFVRWAFPNCVMLYWLDCGVLELESWCALQRRRFMSSD